MAVEGEFSVAGAFPPATYEQWRALAERDLKGAPFEKKLITHTYEGLDIPPVYTRNDWPSHLDSSGLPGRPPYTRGSQSVGAVVHGWDVRQEHRHPSVEFGNTEILDELMKGDTSLLIHLDGAARSGRDSDHPDVAHTAGSDGVMLSSMEDLDELLKNVQLELIQVAFEPGAAFLPVASLMIGLWRRRGLQTDQIRGAFEADPLGTLAREGSLPVTLDQSLDQMADLSSWTAAHLPGVTAVAVDTSPYHDAGANSVQDLAFSMATAVTYLRRMTDRGLSVDAACRQILFSYSIGCNLFLALAKLRAARRLWDRIGLACGASEEARAMTMHVRTSMRVMTARDPWVNMLRTTVEAFAAAIGGAQSITVAPFDAVIGLPNAFSRRIARNTQLILQEESHVNRVIDPAGGSWYVESLTDQLTERAWDFFQQIESHGGMAEAVRDGWAAEQVAQAFAPRLKNLGRRKDAITGVSEFPDLHEEALERTPPDLGALRRQADQRLADQRARADAGEPLGRLQGLASDPNRDPDTLIETLIEAASRGATLGELSSTFFDSGPSEAIRRFELNRFAAPFEELRDASDAFQITSGHRPQVFLVNLGTIAEHTARATYTVNLMEAGGIEPLTNDGFAPSDPSAAVNAFRDSGASVAILCSTDKIYPEVVATIVPQLKQAGAERVVLAGRPGQQEAAFRDAGVDEFIFIGCNALDILKSLMRTLGAIT